MKKLTIEFLGTFFLVLVIGLSGNPVAIGAILMCMVYMGGHLSGGHYNPAVSLGIFLDQKMNFGQMLAYWGFQLLGSFVASGFVFWITKKYLLISPTATWDIAMAVELLFTMALVLVVLNVADHPKTEKNSFYGLAVGFTVLAAAYAGGPISGGAFNPAVAIGPLLYKMIMDQQNIENAWIYLAGPFLGGLLAGLIFKTTKDA